MGARVRFDPWVTLQNLRSGPATTATTATNRLSVATLASVAGVDRQNCLTKRLTKSDLERAAIIEFDAGVPRAWAEGFALILAISRPGAVSTERWRVFINDCGRFLDGWATQAAALGWQAVDLFGWSTPSQLQHLDLAGLVWALEGREIAALTATSATVRMADASCLTYRRTSGPRTEHQISLWELNSDPEAAHIQPVQ